MANLPKSWKHEFYPLTVDPAKLPVGADICALWQERRGSELLPKWSDFSIEDFLPWLGMVSVDEVEHDPFDCRTRLWGTKLTELYGFEGTGRSLVEDYELRGMTRSDFEFWRKVAQRPCIAIGIGEVDWQGRDFVKLARLFLPFGEDRSAVDRIAAVAFQV